MDDGWRKRIRTAIEDSGKSYREVSVAAGLGVNFVSEMLSSGKDPGASKLSKLCTTLGLSLTYVLTGVEMSAEDEEFLQLVSDLPDQERAHLLGMLRARERRAP